MYTGGYEIQEQSFLFTLIKTYPNSSGRVLLSMKPCVGVLLACLAGQALASATPRQHGSDLVSRNEIASTNSATKGIDARGNDTAKYGMKFDTATINDGSYEFQQRIHGSPSELNEFVDDLTLSQLKDLLGSSYGKPFRFTFIDEHSGDAIGYLAGYFTGDGGVSFDEDSRVPEGGSLPRIQKQPSLAPTVTTITLSGGQSAKIIAAGRVSDSQLQEILGADYGGPFKLYLTSAGGQRIGVVSGSFTGSGVHFDDGTNIPDGHAATSKAVEIVAATSKVLKAPAPFKTLDATTVQPPKPTAAPAGANTGSVTISGESASEIEDTLNNLSYDYILNAVNGQYGPFYITFSSNDGSLQGYIKGTITKSTFSYQWSYTQTIN